MSGDPLSQWRAEIDRIDDQLVALIRQRASYVAKVGEHKRATQAAGQSFIRPGREAQMVRAMLGREVGDFPSAALAAMWRLMISGSLSVESPLAAGATTEEGYWLAREYFGAFTPVHRFADAAALCDALESGEVTVGVQGSGVRSQGSEHCQLLSASESRILNPDLWQCLLSHPSLFIFGVAPYLLPAPPSPHTASHFLIGRVIPEVSGEDTSWIGWSSAISLTPEAITAGFAPLTVHSIQKSVDCYAVEVDGAVLPEDPILTQLQARFAAPNLRLLGIAAKPLAIPLSR
jgi:chorismate mutase